MNDNEFWIRVWKYLTLITCVGIFSVLTNCQHTKYQIRKAVEVGADPIETACAMESSGGQNGSLCLLNLQKTLSKQTNAN